MAKSNLIYGEIETFLYNFISIVRDNFASRVGKDLLVKLLGSRWSAHRFDTQSHFALLYEETWLV